MSTGPESVYDKWNISVVISVYEITTKRKQAQTPISLKSGPFPLKFSEIL